MKTLKYILSGLMLLLSPTLTWAVPVTDFVDTVFIGGGIMLFIGGLIMLVIPGLFRTGIITTIIADVLFVARMLFPNKLDEMVKNQNEWLSIIDSASLDASRMYTAILVVCTLVAILGTRWILISIFGSSKPTAKNDKTNKPSKTAKTSTKNSPRKINRDREDFSGYEEEPPVSVEEPDVHSPSHNKRFRVHDYLENLEKQQAYEEEVKRHQKADSEKTTKIDFGRIER